ncbi:hypothetical protein WMY93_032736 [Mugilogobius chulae]|uniref:Uncharacterized protein n=1 Tax=Mugilogobius chulae TaxID=88201 RepID=A0AAW0MQ05_9GOBI
MSATRTGVLLLALLCATNEVEEMGRRALWEEKLLYINTHNLEASLGLHTYTVAMNHLGDLSDEEVSQMYGTLRVPSDLEMEPYAEFPEDVAAPASVDWRKSGRVTTVKNQGQCGSCWAFSADGVCNYKPAYRAANCSTYYGVKPTEDQLKQAVAAYGPISVAVRSSLKGFLYYKSGIFSDPACRGQVDHGVLVVGYGTEGASDYWIVKNSWGTGWGEKGYIRIARNKSNMCSIASYGMFPN